ncbi:MAG: WSC domain-containing protein, partial [Chloroflexales bacterium]|nr:WSC domain-containing protein [Chloroflexales bacterium]
MGAGHDLPLHSGEARAASTADRQAHAASTADREARAASATSGGGKYLGCFKDQGAPAGTEGRDLNGAIRSDGGMTTALCVNECRAKNFAYAGTQYSSYCFCGGSYGKSGAANNCDMKCAGTAGETCGGAWANSVYATGVAAAAVPPPPPAQQG